jgi:hypothetical protein
MHPCTHALIAANVGTSPTVPKEVNASIAPLLAAGALRAIGDGYVAVLLSAYLLSIGLGTLQVHRPYASSYRAMCATDCAAA